MATGRIGVTPNLRTRWSKAPAGGTTSLSGLDDNSVSLVYDAGFEAVYRNGVLLSRGNDYTATNGTTITLIDATIAGDIIEVFANQAIPLTSTYTQAVADGKFINNTLVDAKGDILTATAADTPARLAVGSNDQVLTADSSTATGLKWATPSAGGMTLISSGTASGNTITFSSIPQTYQDLRIQVVSARNTTSGGRQWNLRINSNSGAIYYSVATILPNWTQGTYNNANTSVFDIGHTNTTADNDCYTDIMLYNYTAANINRSGTYFSVNNANPNAMRAGYWFALDLNAITSIQLIMQDSENWAGGTYYLYGVK